jgi:hypothetical protein
MTTPRRSPRETRRTEKSSQTYCSDCNINVLQFEKHIRSKTHQQILRNKNLAKYKRYNRQVSFQKLY